MYAFGDSWTLMRFCVLPKADSFMSSKRFLTEEGGFFSSIFACTPCLKGWQIIVAHKYGKISSLAHCLFASEAELPFL
jgi:hypothetical protein